jgi:hypothetical protein
MSATALPTVQIHQSAHLGAAFPDDDEEASSNNGSGSSAPSSGALCSCPVPCRRSSLWDPLLLLLLVSRSLRFLEIDPKAWAGLEKTAASTEAKHHIGTVRQSPPFPSEGPITRPERGE